MQTAYLLLLYQQSFRYLLEAVSSGSDVVNQINIIIVRALKLEML